MRHFLAFFPAFLLASALVSSPLSAADQTPSGYSSTVEFLPDADNPDGFVFTATISDLETKRVLAQPRIIAKKGEPGNIKIGDRDFVYSIDVLLDKSGHTASYTLTVTKGGKVLTIQKSTISVH